MTPKVVYLASQYIGNGLYLARVCGTRAGKRDPLDYTHRGHRVIRRSWFIRFKLAKKRMFGSEISAHNCAEWPTYLYLSCPTIPLAHALNLRKCPTVRMEAIMPDTVIIVMPKTSFLAAPLLLEDDLGLGGI